MPSLRLKDIPSWIDVSLEINLGVSIKCKIHIYHQRMLQKLDKSGVKWCLSSYFSLPAKFQLVQSGIFGPMRVHRGGSTTLIQSSQISCSYPMQPDLSQPSNGVRSLAAIQWSQTSHSHPMEPDLYGARSLAAIQLSQISCSHPVEPDLSQPSKEPDLHAAFQRSQISCSLPTEPDLSQPSNGARSSLLVAIQWS